MEHNQWQSLLNMGNQSFHAEHWSQAEFFYSEAYDLLAYAYRDNPLCAETLMAWICTCHNLSSLYEATDNLSLALRFLMVPHDYLKEITEAEGHNEDIKLMALKGLSLTLSPILTFAQKHPICDTCKADLIAMQEKIDRETPVTH